MLYPYMVPSTRAGQIGGDVQGHEAPAPLRIALRGTCCQVLLTLHGLHTPSPSQNLAQVTLSKQFHPPWHQALGFVFSFPWSQVGHALPVERRKTGYIS